MSSAQVPEGYKQTEVGVIPKDWEVVPLGKFLNFQNGVNANKASYGHGIPFINISEVMALTHLTYSDIPGLVSLSKQATDLYRVYQGDILFNRTSEVQEELGLTSVYLGDEIVVFGGFVIRGRQNPETLEITYSSYALRATSIRNQIIARGQGVVRANIGQKDLSEIQICIPPLPEQRAIAQALSDVDALIASLDKLIAKQRQLKTAAMQQLLTGKMRLPGFGDGKGYKQTEVGVIPEDWDAVKLGSYVVINSGESPSKFDLIDQGIPYFKVEQLNNDSKYLKTTSYYFRGEKTVLGGSLIFPKRGASILLNKVRILAQDSFMDTNLMTLTVLSELEAEFLYYFLEYAGLSNVADTTSIPQINNKHIIPFLIPFPELEEQCAIATVLSDMDTAITALETRRAKTQAIKQGMMQELLTGRTRLV